MVGADRMWLARTLFDLCLFRGVFPCPNVSSAPFWCGVVLLLARSRVCGLTSSTRMHTLFSRVFFLSFIFFFPPKSRHRHQTGRQKTCARLVVDPPDALVCRRRRQRASAYQGQRTARSSGSNTRCTPSGKRRSSLLFPFSMPVPYPQQVHAVPTMRPLFRSLS
nr:hypothetical protein [Pandoravirus aubagnensis]